ncbi:MAG: hypothetical protein H8D43_02690 [Chloroflexi bacterium]|nr:hypothetical protein [Chloroflexota bacterium]
MDKENHVLSKASPSELVKAIATAAMLWENVDGWDDKETLEQVLTALLWAADTAPDEPWVWFQIGWCSLALGKAEEAQIAFERVLGLDPDNVCGHFALSYLFLETGSYPFDNEYSLPERDPWAVGLEEVVRLCQEQPDYVVRRQEYLIKARDAAWHGTCGEHLRSALAAGGPTKALSTRVHFWEGRLEVGYYFSELSVELFLEHLDALGDVLPENLRTGYYDAIGTALEEIGWAGWDWTTTQAQRWYKKAVRWESKNPQELLLAYVHLGQSLCNQTPPDWLAACLALTKAYSYLQQMPVPADWYSYWFGPVDSLVQHWRPDDDALDLLRLCDAALDLQLFGGRPPKNVSGASMAPVAEAAGNLAIARGDLTLAERYLMQAKSLDPTRVSVARCLSELYIDQQRWSEALAEQQWVVELAPVDRDARRLALVLAVVAKPGLGQRALDTLLTEIAELRAGQDLILEEISLQRDLLQQISDAQRRAQLELRRSLDATATERVYADLIDQLHNLVQQGSRVQMAAVQVAKNRLIEVLGYEYFSALLPDCQHFLVTAETFYATTADIPEQVDAASIAVEYAKVVETELRRRFMAKLGNFLDACQYTGELVIYGKGRRPKRGDKWEKWITSHSFSLGYIGGLLQMTVEHGRNPKVMDYISRLGLEPEAMNRLAKDIEIITKRYRNGAAHTEGLGRVELDEFRDMLFERGLLHRLVDLGTRVERYS